MYALISVTFSRPEIHRDLDRGNHMPQFQAYHGLWIFRQQSLHLRWG